MAERSTAAVDVADNSGEQPLTAKADQSTADGVAKNPGAGHGQRRGTGQRRSRGSRPEGLPRSCTAVTSSPDATGWRSASPVWTDSAAGARSTRNSVVPSASMYRPRTTPGPAPCSPPPGPPPCSATRASSRSSTPSRRTTSSTSSTNGCPTPPSCPRSSPAARWNRTTPTRWSSQVASAMAAAHREGLAHLRLNPNAVLRTSTGQWRIRGLAVNAALQGISSDTPQRTDTESIGALLYAALTQRWPYERRRLRPVRPPQGHRSDRPGPGTGRRAPGPVRAGHACPRQRRGHGVPARGAVHHAGGAGEGDRRDAAHPPARARVHGAAGVPADDLPAGHVRPPGAASRRHPADHGPRRPRSRAAPARP